MPSCRFCGQEIYETETTPGVNGPVHMILPNAPKPTCHCGADGSNHKAFCSFAGKPRAKAKP